MHSLRTYLESLQKNFPDQLVRVKEPVGWRYEITACVAEIEKRGDNPALLFEKVEGHSMPLLINLFGNIERILLCLGDGSHTGGSRLDFYKRWNRLIDKEVPPVYAEKGPVKDLFHVDDDVDLILF